MPIAILNAAQRFGFRSYSFSQVVAADQVNYGRQLEGLPPKPEQKPQPQRKFRR